MENEIKDKNPESLRTDVIMMNVSDDIHGQKLQQPAEDPYRKITPKSVALVFSLLT